MPAESRRTAWARRAVTLVAALSSIATSQRRWHLHADLPVEGPHDAALGVVVHVEGTYDATG